MQALVSPTDQGRPEGSSSVSSINIGALYTGAVSPPAPKNLGGPSPKARAYAFVIRELPENKSVPLHQLWERLRARDVPLQQTQGSRMAGLICCLTCCQIRGSWCGLSVPPVRVGSH